MRGWDRNGQTPFLSSIHLVDEEQANGVENERLPAAQLARILKAIGQFA